MNATSRAFRGALGLAACAVACCQAVTGLAEFSFDASGGSAAGGSSTGDGGAAGNSSGGSSTGTTTSSTGATGGAGGQAPCTGGECPGSVVSAETFPAATSPANDNRGYSVVYDGNDTLLAGMSTGLLALGGTCPAVTSVADRDAVFASFVEDDCSSMDQVDVPTDPVSGIAYLPVPGGRHFRIAASDDLFLWLFGADGGEDDTATWDCGTPPRVSVAASAERFYVALEFDGQCTVNGSNYSSDDQPGVLVVQLNPELDSLQFEWATRLTAAQGAHLGGIATDAAGDLLVLGDFQGQLAVNGTASGAAEASRVAFLARLGAAMGDPVTAERRIRGTVEGVGSFARWQSGYAVTQGVVAEQASRLVLVRGTDLAVGASISSGSGLHVLRLAVTGDLVDSTVLPGHEGAIVGLGGRSVVAIASSDHTALTFHGLDSQLGTTWSTPFATTGAFGCVGLAANDALGIAALGWFQGTMSGPFEPSIASPAGFDAWLLLRLRL